MIRQAGHRIAGIGSPAWPAPPCPCAHTTRSPPSSTRTSRSTFSGTVTKMEWINPHVWLHMDVKMPNGKSRTGRSRRARRTCSFGAGSPRQSLMPGTRSQVDGYQAKDGTRRANGRDMTFSDGKKLFMGSSGTGAPYELARPGR